MQKKKKKKLLVVVGAKSITIQLTNKLKEIYQQKLPGAIIYQQIIKIKTTTTTTNIYIIYLVQV